VQAFPGRLTDGMKMGAQPQMIAWDGRLHRGEYSAGLRAFKGKMNLSDEFAVNESEEREASGVVRENPAELRPILIRDPLQPKDP
jgi:hypothetical protein